MNKSTISLLIMLLTWWPIEAQEIQFENGKYLLDGRLYTGKLVDYHNNGSMQSTLTIYAGLPHDTAYYYHPSGILKTKGLFREGRKHATWTHWDESGTKIREFHYDNGLKHGPWTVWFPNGQVHYSMHYDHGKTVGTWKSYDIEGNLLKAKTYTGPN